MKGTTKNIGIIAFVIIIIILFQGASSTFNLFSTLSGSYSTGYQGAHASFYGVQYEGKSSTGALFDTNFNWDADEYGSGKPRISGEMTSVFVPSDSVGGTGSQPFELKGVDIRSWLLDSTKIKNPVREYSWEIEVGDNKTKIFQMEEWTCKWYFSIACEPFSEEIISPFGRNSLQDAKIWFKLDLTPTWYFEGSSNAYFAIAKIRISDLSLSGKLKGDKVQTIKNRQLRVNPMSEGSILPIHYQPFGRSSPIASNDPLTPILPPVSPPENFRGWYKMDMLSPNEFQGKELNPDLFTDTVYTYFTLEDFGVTSWFDYGETYRADAVTVGCDVNIFVIGEWIVKDIEEIPEDYGKDSKLGIAPVIPTFFDQIIEFLGSPTGRFSSVIVVGVIILLVIAVFAPWVLIGLMQLISSASKRKR